jgi:hypothetical protein
MSEAADAANPVACELTNRDWHELRHQSRRPAGGSHQDLSETAMSSEIAA